MYEIDCPPGEVGLLKRSAKTWDVVPIDQHGCEAP